MVDWWTDAKFSTRWHQFGLYVSCEERPFHLVSSDRMHGMCFPQIGNSELRHTDVSDSSLLDKFLSDSFIQKTTQSRPFHLESPHGFFDGCLVIVAMQIVKIDAVDAQPLQRC